MDFSYADLDMLYCLVRSEALELRDKYGWLDEPEQGSYNAKIFDLDARLSVSFHKRNQTIR